LARYYTTVRAREQSANRGRPQTARPPTPANAERDLGCKMRSGSRRQESFIRLAVDLGPHVHDSAPGTVILLAGFGFFAGPDAPFSDRALAA